MSLVDTSTGEIVASDEVMTPAQAVAVTDAIRGAVADLEAMIVRAYFGRAWVAMGYGSWDEYVVGEFKAAPLALPREERRTQVLSLRQQGMSTRAIGAAIGATHTTVQDDLRGGRNLPPAGPVEHKPITGTDGKTYPERSRPTPEPPPAPAGMPPEPRETCPTCGQTMLN